MEILGVGYQELFLVLVLLLIFVGPERLPQMAYQIGRAVRTMQQYARAVRDEFSDEFEYIEEQYKTVKGQVDETRQSLRDEDRKMQAELRSATAVDLPPLLPAETATGGTNGTTAAEPAPAANGTAPAPEPAPAAAEAAIAASEPSQPSDPGNSAPPLVF